MVELIFSKNTQALRRLAHGRGENEKSDEESLASKFENRQKGKSSIKIN